MSVNIIEYGGSEIVQMNSARLSDLAERVLEYMALNGSCTGSITIGSSNPIGTFIDTVRGGAVGSSNTTILSTTYTLSQVNSTTLTLQNPPYYVGLDSTNPSELILQENLTTLNDIADYILNYAVTVGPFCYYLGTSAPVDGGTWTSLGTLTDTLEGFTVTVNTYHLWKKLSNGSYDAVRPMKILNGELTQYTEDEILSLAKIVEQRIVSTGVGTYALQTSTPGIGTWSTAGTITDIRRTTSDVNYDSIIYYTGTTPASYEGLSPISYEGLVYADYLGPSPVTYTGVTPTNFSGFGGETSFVGAPVPANFAGPSSEVGFTSPIFFGPVFYEGIWPPGTAFLSPLQGYEAAAPPFVIFYSGGGDSYVGPGVASYETAEGFAQAYQGTVTPYYQGTAPGTYLGTVFVNYTGISPANFFGTAPDSQYFSSPIPTNYESTIISYYDAIIPAEFAGATPAYYTGQIVGPVTETITTITLYKRIG